MKNVKINQFWLTLIGKLLWDFFFGTEEVIVIVIKYFYARVLVMVIKYFSVEVIVTGVKYFSP